jgi:TIR domain.
MGRHLGDSRRVALLSTEKVGRIVRECLEEGVAVEIDGLGIFQPSGQGECEFVPHTQPQVFIAYVEEDLEAALRLYDGLAKHGMSPWIDKKKLLPGQNWARAIERAIQRADFVVCCFSRRAQGKRGGFQTELRHALEAARRLPLDRVYLIPIRLEPCEVPALISNEIQYVDMFPSWNRGFRKIVQAIRGQIKREAREDS